MLLLTLSGPSALLGIGTLVAVLPLAKLVVKATLRLRALRMLATDERVRVVSEVLTGIRVTKLNGWEPAWLARLGDVRAREVSLTAQELFVTGCSMVIMVNWPHL